MKKKLIEVSLPLAAINEESAREKSIRHGHPSTLHLWWARRPLASCRAILFAQLVDDPSSHPERFPTPIEQGKERERLFALITELVRWDNTSNVKLASQAHEVIVQSCDGTPPVVVDPFCGGGSIPLEAQRLGLDVHAIDLNPIAVLITKALVEFPPRFRDQRPVSSGQDGELIQVAWSGAQGLAEDVRRYGLWMRERLIERIGYLYPAVSISTEAKAPVVAWIWARTVTCPNPACTAPMILCRSFQLAKSGESTTWVEIGWDSKRKSFDFRIREGTGSPPSGTVRDRSANCLACGSAAPLKYIREEAQAGRMGVRLIAIVAQGPTGRVSLAPDKDHEQTALNAVPPWKPTEPVPYPNHDVDRLPMYGMFTWGDAFTSRQCTLLATLCDLIPAVRDHVFADASAILPVDGRRLEDGGTGADAYADAVACYLGLAVGRQANYSSSLNAWAGNFIVQTFGRQALPMVWDFAEGNPLSDSTGNWEGAVEWVTRCIEKSVPARGVATVVQGDARTAELPEQAFVVATDPPYYDNISYADLSDFFYVWERRALRSILPRLFGTVLTPKSDELIASPYRHDSKEAADSYFLEGMRSVFARLASQASDDFPLTLFYAFKQAEVAKEGTFSTGWATFLSALLEVGLSIEATWPVRTERDQGLKTGSNVLASSILLVCRRRRKDLPLGTRGDFLRQLRSELPRALQVLQEANIAPVDLAQCAIGPGMAIFSSFDKVIESDGSRMLVKTALQTINATLDELLSEQEAEFDPYTRFAITWFSEYGFGEGAYGEAETLATARAISVRGVEEAGIFRARGGKARLLRREELNPSWTPTNDDRLTVWEVCEHLIRILDTEGEVAAASILRDVGGIAEATRHLAYRLYGVCDQRKWAEDARAYNGLVVAWAELERLASGRDIPQSKLFV